MTTLSFTTTGDIVDHVADSLAASLTGWRRSGSHVSPSTYFTLMREVEPDDEEHDEGEELFTIRVSDHATRSCTSRVHYAINVLDDLSVEEIEDDGEFDHLEVEAWRIEDAVSSALAAARAAETEATR